MSYTNTYLPVSLAFRDNDALDFLAVSADTPTKEAIRLMASNNKDYVLVLDCNRNDLQASNDYQTYHDLQVYDSFSVRPKYKYKAVGIFSESDAIRLKYENKDLNKDVYFYASKPVVNIKTSYSLFEAISLMIENNISKLVVADEHDYPVGVLTQRIIIATIDQEMLRKSKNVKDVLKQNHLISLSPNQTLAEALRILVEHKIRALIVIEGNKLMGILTQKDITKLISRDLDLENALIKDYMKYPVFTCKLDTPLIEASKLMAQHNIRRLVVVDDNESPIGIITQGDIIRNIEEKYETYVERNLRSARMMLDIMQDPVLEVADTNAHTQGIVIWQNESSKKVFGGVLGKKITDILDTYTWDSVHKELIKTKSVNYEPIFVGDNIYHISCVYVQDDTAIANGRIKILFRDITNLYKSELELKKINKQYQNILNAMEDMVIIYDPEDYKIKFANRAAFEKLGYSEEELLGKSFFDIVLNSQNVIKHFIDRIIKENKKVVGRRVYIKSNGELLPIHVSATQVYFDNENHILVVARDISKELIIEEKLKNTNKDLNMFYSFITDLSKAHKEDEAYDILVHYFKRLGIDYIHIYRLNPSLNKIVSSYLLKAKNIYEPAMSDIHGSDEHVWVRDCLDENPSLCKVIKSGTPLAVANVSTDYGCPKINVGAPVKSYMCIPIFVGGVYITNATAIISLMSLKENFFDEDTKRKISKLIEAFVPVISNLRLIEINRELSIRDPLTNAYNRRFLDEILYKEFGRAFRTQSKLSIIMLDVDDFKKFNDTYGHRAGDIALQHLANIVMENIRAADIFARYGGEEFVIVLPGTPKEHATEVASRIKEALSSKAFYIPSEDAYVKHFISASFGVATYDDDANCNNEISFAGDFVKSCLETLFSVADERLYKAKKLGKNRVMA
jgi:diguanylate cyclase (GGDEF)-like protein/PAS domain S-box-containing protein